MINQSAIFPIALFGFAAVQQTYESFRALQTKRVRRITFRKSYVELGEDSADFWLATGYHALAAVFSIGVAVWILMVAGN